jgi:hypothetical protein
MWKIIKAHGIPVKVMNIFKELYDGYQCKVKLGRTETAQFTVTSGVKQGCSLSPFLFLIVIDYIIKKATDEQDYNGFT